MKSERLTSEVQMHVGFKDIYQDPLLSEVFPVL